MYAKMRKLPDNPESELIGICRRSVPREVAERAALHLLDWLGCVFAAGQSGPARALARAQAGSGGSLLATAFDPARCDAQTGALASGALGNVLEMDDLHRASLLHAEAIVDPSGRVAADDPRVVAAIEEFGYFALNPDYIAGEPDALAATDFRDSPKGLFDVPPQCMMHRQASFIPAYFPEGTVLGEDADFFYFPAYADKDLGTPVLGAGTLMSITDDSEATRGLMQFFQTAFANEIMMAQDAFLTPHTGANPEAYADDTLRAQGEILTNATTFRFDGSDLMPGAVGAGSFWTGMVDYTGGKPAQEVADEIQKSWDVIK